MDNNIAIPKEKIADFCRDHYIEKLGIFGSALREDFSDDSDIDILVEFQEGHVPGFEFFQIQDELSELIGRKVDLNTPAFLSRYFRNDVLKNLEVQYVRR